MPGFEDAGDGEQALAAFFLQRVPFVVGAPQQGYVVGMLGIGEADRPALAAGRALIVAGVELLDAERADAATCDIVERGTPHGAQSDDDDVCGARHGGSTHDLG